MPFVMGVDVGQARDYTAIVVIEVVRGADGRPSKYHCRKLERLPLGTPFSEMGPVDSNGNRSLLRDKSNVVGYVDQIANNLIQAAQGAKPMIVVDATGEGRMVAEYIYKYTKATTASVIITGGKVETFADQYIRIPKGSLITSLQLVFQHDWLKIAPSMKLLDILIEELKHYETRISNRAHESFGSAREHVHDDLVLALALAAHFAMTYFPIGVN
jgi:hypothetical protein